MGPCRVVTCLAVTQVELFLNSVQILANLTREERGLLANALEEMTYSRGTRIIQQGDPGDLFYIIKEGEAVVYQQTPRGTRLVNRCALFACAF